MKNWLRRFYQSLPVVRELTQIRNSIIHLERSMIDTGILALQESVVKQLREERRSRDPLGLLQAEFQVYSQHGEDGIISEIFRRIGTTNRYFVEIGVGDGMENNTTYVLRSGWSGTWIEGSPESVSAIHSRFATDLAAGQLRLVPRFVTMENITSLLGGTVPNEPDLFSLDIDYNTYWIWKGLREFRPRVVVVEYNANYPATDDWKSPYRPDAVWDGSFHYGASLKAFELLGADKGYLLVGCDLSGTNAFFVRKDVAQDHFPGPHTAENHYEPARYYLNRRHGHPARSPFSTR